MADPIRILGRLETARQELLDLGLRNPLLNYRTLKARGLEIVRERPEEVFRILVADKRKMTFEEASGQWNAARPPESAGEPAVEPSDEAEREQGDEAEPAQSATDSDAPAEFNKKHYDSKLQTNYTAKQLESRLLNTYYYARTYVEEQGVNILYLALGMLHWHDSGSSGQEPRKAPLILVPVQLERTSARERFSVLYTEDEIGHNISLAAKMKAEFNVDIPGLPEDGEPDAAAYFAEVSRAVEGYPEWTVDADSIVIGFFSFGKFLMYRDLDAAIWPEHSRPEAHPIMAALLTDGFKEESAQRPLTDSEPIDPHLKLSEARHILDADSSQIAAILEAKHGRNLVIQGPPGTGKSQTIANLIAECIGSGKKVLFVSEKMAALEVVKRRLDRVGLGVACLELHSHKTNKKALLNELAATLELGKPQYKGDDNMKLLEELRTRLNEYSSAVNVEVGQTGVTPYKAMGELARYRTGAQEQPLPWPRLALAGLYSWSKEEAVRREALIEELQRLLASIGIPVRHPFWGSRKQSVLPSELDALRQELAESRERLRLMLEELAGCRDAYQLPEPVNFEEAGKLAKALEKVLAAPELKGVELRSGKWLEEADALLRCIEAGDANDKLRQRYEEVLIPEAWEQDLLEARSHIVHYQDKWWRFLSSGYRQAKSRVLGLCRNPRGREVRLLELVDAILEARRHKETVMRHEALAMELFPAEWRGGHANWSRLSVLHEWAVSLHRAIEARSLPAWTVELACARPDKADLRERLEKLQQRIADASRAVGRLEEALEFDGGRRFADGRPLSRQPVATILELLQVWEEQAPKLQEIASYNHLVRLCGEEELLPFAEAAEQWDRAGELLLDAFRWNRYQAIADRAFEERPALAHFEGSRHEHAIGKFQELDRCLAELNRAKLAEEHWRKLPQYEAGGQLGVLRREFEKKTRHLPIRQLMLRAGLAIQAVKPVFMMGPLSIASYLQPGSLEFDLVVFDEASQVKPVDAFGAIIRAKQAIVVGDSKQMPPTNFFDSIAREEGEEDNVTADMESILGLFMGQNALPRMLSWHYRSRHESLIAVSNHEFYDNKLVVFPSPDAGKRNSGLIYHHLADTHYDRGRTRTNRQEAATVARAVMDHARRHPELTLGVAAFSMAQMQAVLVELETLRRSEPDCEPYFAAHSHEPFFVKNLENVQGDERDVIFISIGYGRTKDGLLAMDFGPLNREGGERRLNVLITRSRLRCEVFTNLKAEELDLKRTSARGVQALKSFLQYAESGRLDGSASDEGRTDAAFEMAVRQSLVSLGYEVKTRVGSATLHLDLAVMDPDEPGRYLLGIECDGEGYHKARSARDRDRLRQEVLSGLGWRLHRIWSADWFRHPEREWKRLVDAIEQARLSNRANRVEDGAGPRGPNVQRGEGGHGRPSSQDGMNGRPVQVIRRDNTVSRAPAKQAAQYEMADLKLDLEGKEFHSLPAGLVASWVHQVVQLESPVHVGEVMKRVCDAIGIRRAGSRIQELFELAFAVHPEVIRRGDFLWLGSMELPPVRDRSELRAKKLEWIAEEELAEAVLKAARESFGAEEEVIIQSAYQSLGFARVTEELRTGMQARIRRMLEQERLLLKSGLLTAPPQ